MTKPWAERLEQDTFIEQDESDAAGWQRCAVGEVTGGLCPVDKRLYQLWCAFADAVELDNIRSARRIYNRIQKRAAELRNQEAAP